MKGRHGAAHFAAFPRPPNYSNRNPNGHTNTKEKKLKRILASVFLVLAVIAAVGIFGVQTSDRTEAVLQDAGNQFEQAIPAAHGQDEVTLTTARPRSRTLPSGRIHTIDLKDYTVAGDDQTATTTYTLGDFAGNPANVIFIINGQEVVSPAANDMVIPNGILRIKAGPTAGSTGVTWRAWSTHAYQAPATPGDATAANGFPHTDAGHGGTGNAPANKVDSIQITVIAGLGDDDPALPAAGATRALSAPALSTATAEGAAGTPVNWVLRNYPPDAYETIASSSDTDVAEVALAGSPEGSTVRITPKAPGTATIKVRVQHELGSSTNDADAVEAAMDGWTLPDQTFTVTYAADAPSIDINANTQNAPGNFNRNGSEDQPIIYTIRSDHTGEVGKFRTISGADTGDATYINRNVVFILDDGDDIAPFEIDTEDPAVTGGTRTRIDGVLSVAADAELEVGDYNFNVTAVDQVDRAPGIAPGIADTVPVTVRVVQGNEAPDLDTLPNIVIPDASPVGYLLLDLNGKATDPNRNVVSYEVEPKAGSANAGQFDTFFDWDVTEGAADRYMLKLKAAVDYDDVDNDGDTDDDSAATDAQKDAVRWTLTVTATDGALSDTQDITVSVSDSGLAPPSQLTNVFYVPENSERDTVLGVIGQSGETWTGFAFNNQFGSDNRFFRLENATATEYNSYVDRDGTTRTISAGTQGVLVVGGEGPDLTDGTDDDVDATFNYEDADTTDNVPPKRAYTLAVTARNAAGTSVGLPITVNVTDVNEAPEFGFGDNPLQTADGDNIEEYVATVVENADDDTPVAVGARQRNTAAGVARPNSPFTATDEDAGDRLTYSLLAESSVNADGTITDPEVPFSGPFTIKDASTGVITVLETDAHQLDAENTATQSYTLYIKVADDDSTPLSAVVKLTITVMPANERPFFVATAGSTEEITDRDAVDLNENNATWEYRFFAHDPDGDDLTFILRTSPDSEFFDIDSSTGWLRLKDRDGDGTRDALDYEQNPAIYRLDVEVQDADLQGETELVINLKNLNDEDLVWQAEFSPTSLNVNENTSRNTLIGTYAATNPDGADFPITYTLGGPSGTQYRIGEGTRSDIPDALGALYTLASLDADPDGRFHTITVTASDGVSSLSRTTRITVNNLPDRVSAIDVSMANPVRSSDPQLQGDPNTALADGKRALTGRPTRPSNAQPYLITVPESPADLPASRGSSPTSFVATSNASWGTVLRIEVLAESPDRNCGNGNQCIVIELEGDDSDHKLNLMAFRQNAVDNKFIAAVMPWRHDENAAQALKPTSVKTGSTPTVYKHTDNSVPRIHVDEEDTLRIKFVNLRESVTIDNEAPEFSNFLPEHETSIDDEDVEYTFTVTDAISGIPDPEDLPDLDGDDAYMPVVALLHTQQCHNVAEGEDEPSGTTIVPHTNLHNGEQIYCNGTPEVRDIHDDKDLDKVTDGYDVTTELSLSENTHYVTFIVCDAAGNCVAYDPDENDRNEALAEIIVDVTAPRIDEARTGVMWDASAGKYDKDGNRRFIQVIFIDNSDLNPDTIEPDDFVVSGHTIKDVYPYDDPDDGEEEWDTRFDREVKYRAIAKTVFIELEEELLPDATPTVSLVPNGIEDKAGNERDDGETDAEDWIAPAFTVTSIESPRETSRDNVLVGEDEKVTLTVTSDERINSTKPRVQVNYVNAPAGCVDRDGIILSRGRDDDSSGRIEPDETRPDCAGTAVGGSLSSVISRDSTQEWTITVDKPTSTGYYNVYISADDRSTQRNEGSEGVALADIATNFFEKDGDVNADDAIFFEGDIQLPKPQVIVSGKHAGDSEPTVEFKRPLFVEVDFTENFNTNEEGRNDCSAADKISSNSDTRLECVSEGAEYAEDGFDAVTITRFELDGVDMTEDVKTTDDETFLVALDDVGIGDHKLKIQAIDVAGNELKDVLEIEFAVEERDPFTRRLNPGWNLVSLPGSPADSAIASVFGSDIEVRTVYTYNPVTPGGWQVAVRETLDDAWQGDLTDITAKSGYWVLSDAIQDLEVSIPRLAGGAVGASTPVQPPVIPMYAGWNLIPVVDVTGDALDTKKSINATTYLNSLDDGLDLARVLGFNTITNEWFTVIDPSDASVTDNLQIGSAYWVFVRESASLVPGGIPR